MTSSTITVSSTFSDLRGYRAQLDEMIRAAGHETNIVEFGDSYADEDVIASALRMVRDSDAFVGIIGHRRGYAPLSANLNPDRLSITELEFNEALKLDRPILMLVTGDEHPIEGADAGAFKHFELEAFRTRARRQLERGGRRRTYLKFNNQREFTRAVRAGLERLDRELAHRQARLDHRPDDMKPPRPPALAAFPCYIGSHQFVGRAAELAQLDAWSDPADPDPVLLIQGIGGAGKSILCWEWLSRERGTTHYWAGRFWYSFYATGAGMTDFCRQALAYMTSVPAREFARMRIGELSDLLIAQLEARPWLLVLDGLERILVAYQRPGAAQLRDENADFGAGESEMRDHRATIYGEDEALLRRLTRVTGSKLLINSRLAPLSLIDETGSPLPGVRRMILSGLEPGDAETLFRESGVSGDSAAIQDYLKNRSDCHPLVIGVLAGLINNYSSEPGNFDRWRRAEAGKGVFNQPDLVQRRNHILFAALDRLSAEGRRLLHTLAIMNDRASFDILQIFNPHLPPAPTAIEQPHPPRFEVSGASRPAEAAAADEMSYRERHRRWTAHLDEMAEWRRSPAVIAAPGMLALTIRDLERRGLIQYDPDEMVYGLHPVVRGVILGRMDANPAASGNAAKAGAIDAIKADLEREWTGLPVTQLCIDLLRFIIRRPSASFERLTFPALAEGMGRMQVDEDLISAVTILVSSRMQMLTARAIFIDDDSVERDIDISEINGADRTGWLTHPVTGDRIFDYATRLIPFVSPSDRMIEVITGAHD